MRPWSGAALKPGFPHPAWADPAGRGVAVPAARDWRIERIGADGDGIASGPDRALYVPFTLPGELVHARPTHKRGEGFAAVAETLIEPSVDRVAPPCPHFGSCGGCALQHWRDAPYVAWKEGLLAAALRRAGFADLPPIDVARTPPGARRRVDLALRREGQRIVVGLHEAHGPAVVDLHVCTVLHPALAGLLDPLHATLGHLSALRRQGSAILNLLESGPDLLLRVDADLTTGDRTLLSGFAETHRLPRVSWVRGTGPAEPACTLRPATTVLSGVTVRPPPGTFLQAASEGEAAIVAAVIAGLPAKRTARARVAELYAGCGTLTFALARHCRVVAYEGDAGAAEALRAGANQAGLAGRVEAVTRDLARQPVSAKELTGSVAVVLDPPFAGAGPQIGAVAVAGAARVVYVSCNPVALATDARMLRQTGYGVSAVTLIDQFLWSPRLESVVVFART